MCGIVGAVSGRTNGFSAEELVTFRDMLVFDAVRGFDSTGVFGVTNAGDVKIRKAAKVSGSFVQTTGYDQWHNSMYFNGTFMVGHNRAATRGVINDNNAHPFWKDDKIILVQNGTYKGSHKHIADTEVDSEALAHLLAREDDVEKAVQQVDAAYALVWYNTTNHTLHMLRNSERPLYVCYTEDDTVLFASEPNFIMCAAYRNGVKLKKPPYMLQENNLVTFTLDLESKDWSSTNTQGDYSFRRPQYSNVSDLTDYRRYYIPWEFSGEVEDTDNVVDGLAQWRNSPSANLRNVHDVTQDTKLCGDFLMSEQEKTNIMSRTRNEGPGTQHLVQLLDYVPGNNHPNCTAWWLYGSDPKASNDNPSPYYYRLYTDKTKEEMDKILEEEYVWVTCATPQDYKSGMGEDTNLYVVVRFITAMEAALNVPVSSAQ